jgi:hypothetical protein
MVVPVSCPISFVVILTAVQEALANPYDSGASTFSVFVGEAGEAPACKRGSLLFNFTLEKGADFGPPFGAAACSRSGDRREVTVQSSVDVGTDGVAVSDCSFEGDLLIRWCARSTGSATAGRLPLLCSGGGGELYRIPGGLIQEFVAGRCVLASGERAGSKYSMRGENAAAMKLPDCAVDIRQGQNIRPTEIQEELPTQSVPQFSQVPERNLHEEEEDTTTTTTTPDPFNKDFGRILLIASISIFVVLITVVQILHMTKKWPGPTPDS